jgi:hypothetical protein
MCWPRRGRPLPDAAVRRAQVHHGAADFSRVVSAFRAASTGSRAALVLLACSIVPAAAGAQHAGSDEKPAVVVGKPTVEPPKPAADATVQVKKFTTAPRRARKPVPNSAAHAVGRIIEALGARPQHDHSSPLHRQPAKAAPPAAAPSSALATRTTPARPVAPVPRPPAASARRRVAPPPLVPRREIDWPARIVAMQWPAPPPRIEMSWPAEAPAESTTRGR